MGGAKAYKILIVSANRLLVFRRVCRDFQLERCADRVATIKIERVAQLDRATFFGHISLCLVREH